MIVSGSLMPRHKANGWHCEKMNEHVYVVQGLFNDIAGIFSNLETAHAAAAAAELENDAVYDVTCHDIVHSSPEEWETAREREAALKSERKRKEKLVDDVELLQTACADVPRIPVFEMPESRDAFDTAWTEYDAKRNDVRSQVREAAKAAGVYNYAAELVVVADKLGQASKQESTVLCAEHLVDT